MPVITTGVVNSAGPAQTTLTSTADIATGLATLNVEHGDPAGGNALKATATGAGFGVVGNSTSNYGVLGNSNSSNGVAGFSNLSAGVYGLGEVGVQGQSTAGASGVHGDSATGIGVSGNSVSGNGVFGHSTNDNGVEGRSLDSNASGVYGQNDGGGYGVAGRADGPNPAVLGENTSTGNGVAGLAVNGPGVFGFSSTGPGVFGSSSTGPAARFSGNVTVTGQINKTAVAFKIDHPLDPENKYLLHSGVESPDMKNVYDGTCRLDEDGSASIELPEWFGELNRDYRYQLTAIGQPAPDLHIADEISENRFRIAGGTARMKVSWQVTGIRKDPWAEMNRIVVEEDKPEEARGTYLHPEAFGQPETQGEDYSREEALRSRLQHFAAILQRQALWEDESLSDRPAQKGGHPA